MGMLDISLVVLVLLAAPPPAPNFDHKPDRIQTSVEARVAENLRAVDVRVETRWIPSSPRPYVPVVLGADRYQHPPADLPAAQEPLMFIDRFRAGGFSNVRVRVDGHPCEGPIQILQDRAQMYMCGGAVQADRKVVIEVQAHLTIPKRLGPFGYHRRQLTAGGRWYPLVASPGFPAPQGEVHVQLDLPAGVAAVVGNRYFPWVPQRLDSAKLPHEARRRIETRQSNVSQVPFVVLPPETFAREIPEAKGRIHSILVWPRGMSHRPQILRREKAFQRVLQIATRYPSEGPPVIVVEAPLRRDLARGLDGGMVLVSDHAYRFFADRRLDRFHDRVILRQILFTQTLNPPNRPSMLPFVSADMVASGIVDRWLLEEGQASEDAFDVVGLFSFVPAIDSLLYAPQIPFVEAYFRVIKEEDPLRAQLAGYPSGYPRGKLLYEKLVDRIGYEATQKRLEALKGGKPLDQVLQTALDDGSSYDAAQFIRTWLGPYPKVRYRLGSWGSEPPKDGTEEVHQARIEILRMGETVAEPVTVALKDANGVRSTWVLPASEAPQRILTATLASSLRSVVIDPEGRLAQESHPESPNPRLDDRSHPGWRVLLNSFNILLGASAGTVNTALNLQFSKRWDPTWRFGLSGRISPEAYTLTGRAVRGIGPALTPNQRAAWVGAAVTADRLRAGFVEGADAGWATRVALFGGYDNRTTTWAPEPGWGLRLGLGYARILSENEGVSTGGTTNAFSFSVAGLRSWRVRAAHTLSLRGRWDAWFHGEPRPQLLFNLGGRAAVRGYQLGALQGRSRGLLSGEWLHPLLRETDVDAFKLVWADRLDGAFFADVSALGDELIRGRQYLVRADVGYGLRAYLSYLGVRPGVLAVDIALPLIDRQGRVGVGAPEVYIAFSQSFLSF